MAGDLFALDNYALNPHAMPTALAAGAVLVATSIAAVAERGSRAIGPFIAVALSMLLWMIGSTLMYLSDTQPVAEFWSRFGTIGIVFIPAAAYRFCALQADFDPARSWTVRGLYALSTAFLLSVWLSPAHIVEVTPRWWGYYPVYGWIGQSFILFTSVTLYGSLSLLWRECRKAREGSMVHRRTRLLLAGVAIATLSGVDFLPTIGFDVYPISSVTIMALFGAMLYVVHRYHLVDITPALAGQKILETMSDALVILNDDRRIHLVNPAACTMLGRDEEALLGRQFLRGFNLLETRAIVDTVIDGGEVRDEELVFRDGDEEPRVFSLSASLLKSPYEDVLAIVIVMCDVTDRRRAEDRIHFLAYNDAQTGLPNRLQHDRKVREMLGAAAVGGETVTLFFLDVDRFKRINDTLGHDAGDALLCAVAARLEQCIRERNPLALDRPRALNGFVARLGGDEFAIALSGISQIMEIRKIAQQILDDFAEPFTVGEHDVFVGTSIGIAQFPRDGADVQTLLKHADTAMYHAKDAGRNNYKFYCEEMEADVVTHLDLEADLRRALDQGQFEVHYQPQVDFRTGEIVGSEALLRWRHPERGLVSPAEFVPLAEESGLICPIGQWVLQTACRQNRAWQDMGFANLHVAVNLSERQFLQNTLVLVASQALAKSGLDPRSLELELTEGTIMRNVRDTQFTLNELKAMGIRISVDDFGTGYSSLSYLKKFPIDVIKIDRSFVRDLESDADDGALGAAIIAMTASHTRAVIAEGVETTEQAEILLARGCHLMQGYHFSRPLPADQFTAFLRDNAATAPMPIEVEVHSA